LSLEPLELDEPPADVVDVEVELELLPQAVISIAEAATPATTATR
jgi:hypothetical protein